MNNVLLALAMVVPALSLVVSGVALLRTPSRLAGGLMVAAGVGITASFAAWSSGHDRLGASLLLGSILLPGALAVVSYPRASFSHPVDFCTWVVVVGAGALAIIEPEDAAVWSAFGTISLLAVAGHLWWKFERSDDHDRLAVLWLTVAALSIGSILGVLFLVFGETGAVAGALLLSVIAFAMVIGVRQPEVVDVRALIVEAVVVGVVALTYISLYVGVLAGVDLVWGRQPSDGVLALLGVVLAAGFHPLRVVLRGVIDELLFGDRPDPLTAATQVVDRIGDDPVLALRAIREALVLPYASLSAAGEELATSGTAVTFTRRLPLSLGDDLVGEIVVGLRPGDLTLSAGDEHVLRIVAPLLAQTLRARALADDLRVSRGAAIAAIAEERSRLRRDLHDGLGPTLSGIAYASDAARNTLRGDPGHADELLKGIRRDATTAIAEIRRLVYAMRPPALDELGLVPALRQQIASVRTVVGQPMQVTVEAPANLPKLSAAVEVAAYRIATEAVTNAARHSGTDVASVRLQLVEGRFTIEVRDPGGTPTPWVPGVGLSSMHERAKEVGGTLDVERDDEGSLVRASLPLD